MDFVVTEKKIEYEMKAEEAYSQLKNKVVSLTCFGLFTDYRRYWNIN